MSARNCRRGRRSRGAEPSGQLLQLRDALGRRLLITHRHARRDVHGEEEDTALPREEAGVRERAAEAPHRRPGITLRQQQATPPRLAVVAQSDGLGECLLGTVQVAATHPDLDQLAVPPAGAVPVDPEQLLARLQDPLFRLRQLTVEPVDLTLVEPAQPRVAGDRLALAVAGRHLGPLGGPPPVAERSADRDHRAVHVAGVDRGDPGSHGQRRRLVEQREHLADLTGGGGHVGQPLHRHRLHARAAHPSGDRARLEERCPRPVGVSTLHQREGQRPLSLRVLGALRRLGQVFGGSDVAGEGHRAVEHHRVVAGLLQGHAGGTGIITCVGERHLRPFEGVQEPSRITGPTARPGEPLEVVGPDRLIGVGVAQRGPRRGPLALVVRGPGVVEERLTRGHTASLSCRTFRTTLPSGWQLYDLGVR